MAIEHVLELAAHLQLLPRQMQADGLFILDGTLLNQKVCPNHHADIIGWIRAETLTTIGQLANRHIILANVLENDYLYRVEIAHPFRIEGFPGDLQKLAIQPLDHADSVKYSSISNPVSYGVVTARNLLSLRTS